MAYMFELHRSIHTYSSLFIILIGTQLSVSGQTNEELKAMKAEKAKIMATFQGKVDSIKKQIDSLDKKIVAEARWKLGALGKVGFNFDEFNEWLSRDKPNIRSATIGVSGNAFANYITPKGFWRNSLNLNLSWVRFDDESNPDDSNEFRESVDVINFSTLYGYNFNKKLAVSFLGEFRSTVLSNFSNPGYLDVGTGVTWTPKDNLVIVLHPLNQNFILSQDEFDYKSSFGGKLLVNYTQQFFKVLSWKTNLSVFQTYRNQNLSNWTWVNSVNIKLVKRVGVALELGLRDNKQEALAAAQKVDPNTTFETLKNNPLQSYYVMGVSYNIGTK